MGNAMIFTQKNQDRFLHGEIEKVRIRHLLWQQENLTVLI